MSDAKLPCRECGRLILPATAQRTRGICMQCHHRAFPPTIEVTPKDEERFRAIEAIVEKILAATSSAALQAAHCPVCRGTLELSVHPRKRTIFLRCQTSSLHLSTHREVAALPSWMDEYVSGGWLMEGHPTSSNADHRPSG